MSPSFVITVGVESGFDESSIRIASPVPICVILNVSEVELLLTIKEPDISADPVNGNAGGLFNR